MEDERRADPITVDSLRGRYGDPNASTRIIERLLLLDEVGISSVYNITDAVAYLSNAQAVHELAQRMRSEKMIRMAGGGKIPLRDCIALALIKLNRDTPDFPVRDEDFMFSNEKLDKIEVWCTQHTGINYSKGKRKEVLMEPSIIP